MQIKVDRVRGIMAEMLILECANEISLGFFSCLHTVSLSVGK